MNFYKFKLIFSLYYVNVTWLSGMLLSFPQPPNLQTSNNPGDKHHLLTFFFLILLKLY